MKKIFPVLILILNVLFIACIFTNIIFNYNNLSYVILFFITISLVAALIRFKSHKIISILLLLFIGLHLFIFQDTYCGNCEPPKPESAIVKANTSNMKAIAESMFKETKSYKGFCSSFEIENQMRSLNKHAKDVKCFDDEDSFIIAAQFKKPTGSLNGPQYYYCTDSQSKIGYLSELEYNNINKPDSLCPRDYFEDNNLR